MDELTIVQKIAVMALPLVFAIVLHEVAHGWVADKLGDHTARDMGRLTLNPISHIDLFGTVIMPVMLMVMNAPVFGYAKPVPINPYNFKDPKRGMALSSIAGPATNLLMALGFAFTLRILLPALKGILPGSLWEWFGSPVALMCFYGAIINVFLAVLNLIPIPPLDGSRIVYWLLPEKQAGLYYRLEPYGFIVILALFALNILGKIILPVAGPVINYLVGQQIF
jgi:Zn-dependent protease